MGHTERSRVALATSLIAALLAGSLGFLFAMGSAAAMTPDTGFEQCLRDKHNAARSAAGLAPLDTRSEMVSFARNHTAVMIDAGKIFHSGNLGSATTGWTKLGENVGVGGGCDSLHNAFMNSAGHKANILDKAYTSIGVGGGQAPNGQYFVTVVFAAHKGAAPATTTPTTTAPAPTTTAAPRPTPTAAPKATTTTLPPTTTTTTTVSAFDAMPDIRWGALVGDLIKIALLRTLPVGITPADPIEQMPGTGISES